MQPPRNLPQPRPILGWRRAPHLRHRTLPVSGPSLADVALIEEATARALNGFEQSLLADLYGLYNGRPATPQEIEARYDITQKSVEILRVLMIAKLRQHLSD